MWWVWSGAGEVNGHKNWVLNNVSDSFALDFRFAFECRIQFSTEYSVKDVSNFLRILCCLAPK